MNPQNAQLLFFGAIILVIVLLMFRNSRKRQRDQAALSQGLQPGAEIMTTFGLYGTVVSVDDADNKIVLRTGPDSQVTIHRQAMGRIVTPVEQDAAAPTGAAPSGAQLNGAPVVLDDAAADPQFGQRVDGAKQGDAARGSRKNAD